MIRWLVGVSINAVLFIALSGFFSSFYVENWKTAFLASFILAILNIILRPILLILTLPINIFTLGLFTFVVNALMLQLTSHFMGSSFVIEGFGIAILAAAFMAFANMIIHSVLWENRKK